MRAKTLGYMVVAARFAMWNRGICRAPWRTVFEACINVVPHAPAGSVAYRMATMVADETCAEQKGWHTEHMWHEVGMR